MEVFCYEEINGINIKLVIAVIMVFPFGLETRAQEQCQAGCAFDMKDDINCCVDIQTTICTGCVPGGPGACIPYLRLRDCISDVKDNHVMCIFDCNGS